MAYENQEIVNGANPSIIWTQYMDFLSTYARQMKSTYIKRMRENSPFSWTELDIMNQELHHKLDVLMTWNENVQDKIDNPQEYMRRRPSKRDIPVNTETKPNGNTIVSTKHGYGADNVTMESKKSVKKITESQLRDIVTESVKKVIMEGGAYEYYHGLDTADRVE